MGNAAAKHADETTCIDGGYLFPTGTVYPKMDADVRVVRRLILDRKLAPFYVGVDKENEKCNFECPICFLYLPSNVNLTRCCGQPLCTECFLQIKHPIAGGPATCPFCVEPEFGVTYRSPTSTAPPTHVDANGRRRSLPHTSGLVVTVDQVRPSGRRSSPSSRANDMARRATIVSRAMSTRVPRPSEARVARSAISIAPQDRPASSRQLANSYSTGSDQALESRMRSLGMMDVDSELERMMILEAIRLSLQDADGAAPAANGSRDVRANTTDSSDSSNSSSSDSTASSESSSEQSSSSDDAHDHLNFD